MMRRAAIHRVHSGSTLDERECRRVVFDRDGGMCRIRRHDCTLNATEWAHVLTRAYPSVRCDPANSLAACHGCHQWADANRTAFRAWWAEQIGVAEMARLRRARATRMS